MHAHCNILYPFLHTAPQPCQESSLQLNLIDSTYTEYYIAFYSVRYCQSNTFSTVCSDGVTDEEAALFCQQDGYTRKLFYVLPEIRIKLLKVLIIF